MIETSPDAFAAIARSCLRQYRLNEDILLRQPTSEAIHQARVALRRLRAAFALFKALLGDPESVALNHRLRDLARTRGRLLRWCTLAAGYALPLALLLAASAGGASRAFAVPAAVCCLAGLLVERWLFFAEARHVVRLWHGATDAGDAGGIARSATGTTGTTGAQRA